MKRGGRLKPMSKKRRKREDEAKPVRDQLKAEVGRCEVCLKPRDVDYLAGHEIANSGLRQKSLDKRFGVLVVCRQPDFANQTDCHRTVQNEPEARQLARLYLCRQSDYDLTAFNAMVNPRAPNRITQDEVDAEIENLLAARSRR